MNLIFVIVPVENNYSFVFYDLHNKIRKSSRSVLVVVVIQTVVKQKSKKCYSSSPPFQFYYDPSTRITKDTEKS